MIWGNFWAVCNSISLTILFDRAYKIRTSSDYNQSPILGVVARGSCIVFCQWYIPCWGLFFHNYSWSFLSASSGFCCLRYSLSTCCHLLDVLMDLCCFNLYSGSDIHQSLASFLPLKVQSQGAGFEVKPLLLLASLSCRWTGTGL